MKFKLFTLFSLLSLWLVVFGSVQAAQPVYQDAGNPQLDAVIERALRQHNVPGASVAVVKNGALAWAKGYGLADTTQRLPVAPDTVFEAASVSKSVTAWGIMKLVEEGLLDLDAPIEQYLTRWHLPPSEFDHDGVTIRRILSHTAGLSTDGDPGVEPGEYVPTLEEALNGAVPSMRALHVATPPGEGYHYSSIGYALLELVVEEVTDEPFASYMQREILDPLGMADSNYDLTPDLRAKAAVGHGWHNNRLPEYQYATRAQGSLRTTAPDLATFVAASMPGPNGERVGRGVLAPASVVETLTPVSSANGAEFGQVAGLGYDQLIMVDGKLLGARKGGDNRGYHSIIVMALEEGEGIAILTNGDRAIVGFMYDVVCAWSETVAGHLMQDRCRQLMTIRNVQFIFAGVLTLGALAYIAWIVTRIQTGRRRLDLRFTFGKIVRIALLVIILVAWWVIWYTDILLVSIGYPKTAVTVYALVPWATTFIWISWAVTLWLLIGLAVTFAPKAKEGIRR